MKKRIKKAKDKPLEDWQRDLLGENIGLFYSAMKQHNMEHHSDTDVGRDVLAYVTRAMRNYDPSLSKLSTYIYTYVDFGLRAARKQYRDSMQHSTYALSSFGSETDDDLVVVDPTSVDALAKEPYLIEELEECLKYLPAQQRQALMLYYRDGHTCHSGGKLMGLSKQRYQQLINNALNKLKLLMPKPNWQWD